MWEETDVFSELQPLRGPFYPIDTLLDVTDIVCYDVDTIYSWPSLTDVTIVIRGRLFVTCCHSDYSYYYLFSIYYSVLLIYSKAIDPDIGIDIIGTVFGILIFWRLLTFFWYQLFCVMMTTPTFILNTLQLTLLFIVVIGIDIVIYYILHLFDDDDDVTFIYSHYSDDYRVTTIYCYHLLVTVVIFWFNLLFGIIHCYSIDILLVINSDQMMMTGEEGYIYCIRLHCSDTDVIPLLFHCWYCVVMLLFPHILHSCVVVVVIADGDLFIPIRYRVTYY